MASLTSDADLDTVCGFMNTVDVEEGADALADDRSFATWLAESGLSTGAPSASVTTGGDELERARRLRDTLRDLARVNHDAAVDADATRALNDVVAAVGLTVHFTPDGRLELTSAATGVDRVLSKLVAAVAAGTADGTWRRVKICANDRCQWAFRDGSRNRSGRWCSMAVCGNRMKARTFRSRHE